MLHKQIMAGNKTLDIKHYRNVGPRNELYIEWNLRKINVDS